MSLTAETLAETHAAAFVAQRPWTAPEFEALLKTTGLILCGDARSFLVGRVVAGEAELLTVATHPDFQRCGLAKHAMAQFLDAASAKEAERVFLEVADDNVAAIQLYQKYNFLERGRRTAYYSRPDGTKADAVIMQRLL